MSLEPYTPIWSTTGDPPDIGNGTLVGRFELASPPGPPVAVFVGDSYTAGAHATVPGNRFTALIAAAYDWTEVNLGRGGTGYITPVSDPASAMVGCGLGYCPSYLEMIPAVVAAGPAVVVVSGGRNDAAQPWPDVAAGIPAFYAALREALPGVPIVAMSPIWDTLPPPVAVVAMCTVVRRSVIAAGGLFVDLGDPLLGWPDRVAGDGIHPNDAGHAAIADSFAAAYAMS